MLNQPTPINEPSGELARLREDLIAFYRPVSSQERFAIERIALAQQSMRRAARIEDALFAAPDLLTIMSGQAFKLFLRYQAQAQRSYRLAVDEFLFLRDNRSPAPAANPPSTLKPQAAPAPAASPASPPRPPAAGNLALRL